MEAVFDRTEAIAQRSVGHIHGNTSHVKSLLIGIEECIHHMQADVRKLRRLNSFHGQVDRVTTGYGGYRANGGHGVYGGSNLHHGNRGYVAPPTRQYGGYGQHGHDSYGGRGRGTSLDRSGITIGNGNVRFRINF